MSAIAVRPAVPEDVPFLLEMIRELADYEKEPPETVQATEDGLSRWLFGPDPRCEGWIGAVDGQPAGMMVCYSTFSTWTGVPGYYVEDLYVTPALRGQGLGRALLAAAARVVVERGWQRLDLQALDWNTPARDAYAALGFHARTDWVPYRAEGADLERLAGMAS